MPLIDLDAPAPVTAGPVRRGTARLVVLAAVALAPVLFGVAAEPGEQVDASDSATVCEPPVEQQGGGVVHAVVVDAESGAVLRRIDCSG
ncbi:hypothetical protein GCM10010168_71730 [Actinoplanes ianthinogenes]|uniref:Secreted protein n=1 Tax=Actinoplanes ianthinogenes TaxID=122358 RepID=A0ABN6CPR7_9ACTN|nr:hypothetical protein [Actinoplanes ianthinogenes]BCJ47238.1 hypothetical protein Aiant_78950 [Actinoplanes ianthinogenes]GGR42538.1 hypothetical protein GCM10010168_71730 [Actinoplanes ianthinogenes]